MRKQINEWKNGYIWKWYLVKEENLNVVVHDLQLRVNAGELDSFEVQ